MTEQDPTHQPTRRRPARFASPGFIRFLAGTVLLIGVIATVAGVAYAINGATQTRGDVDVPVIVRLGAALEARGTGPGGTEQTVRIVNGDDDRVLALSIPGLDPTRAPATYLAVLPNDDAVVLVSGNSTTAEQLLSRGGIAVLGVCVGIGAVLLRRLLLSIADGRPFQRGNAVCIAGLAAAVIFGSLASDLLPSFASGLVLDRLALSGPGSPVHAGFGFDLVPLLIGLVLLAIAEAFRRGTELSQDVQGLV